MLAHAWRSALTDRDHARFGSLFAENAVFVDVEHRTEGLTSRAPVGRTSGNRRHVPFLARGNPGFRVRDRRRAVDGHDRRRPLALPGRGPRSRRRLVARRARTERSWTHACTSTVLACIGGSAVSDPVRVGFVGAGSVLWAYLQVLDRLVPRGLASEGPICARRREAWPDVLRRRPGAQLVDGRRWRSFAPTSTSSSS